MAEESGAQEQGVGIDPERAGNTVDSAAYLDSIADKLAEQIKQRGQEKLDQSPFGASYSLKLSVDRQAIIRATECLRGKNREYPDAYVTLEEESDILERNAFDRKLSEQEKSQTLAQVGVLKKSMDDLRTKEGGSPTAFEFKVVGARLNKMGARLGTIR